MTIYSLCQVWWHEPHCDVFAPEPGDHHRDDPGQGAGASPGQALQADPAPAAGQAGHKLKKLFNAYELWIIKREIIHLRFREAFKK